MQMWILAAQFELRQLRLDAARKILGMSLGMCPKDRTYKAYIEVMLANAPDCGTVKQAVGQVLKHLQVITESVCSFCQHSSHQMLLRTAYGCYMASMI